MRRRVYSGWTADTLRPGDVSLLTRAAESHWVWPDDIEVVHVYLTAAELADTCRDMYERDIDDVELRDEVKADDPAIHRTAMLLAAEADQGGAGSSLLGPGTHSSVVGLHPAAPRTRPLSRTGRPRRTDVRAGTQRARFVHEHLDERVTLDDLAASVSLSRFHFARRFRQSFGTSPRARSARGLRPGSAHAHQHAPARHRRPLRIRRSEPPEPGVQETSGDDAGRLPQRRARQGLARIGGSHQVGGRVRNVHSVLAQRLDRHRLEHALVRRRQDDRRRESVRVGLPPAQGHAPAIAGRSPASDFGRGVTRSLPTRCWCSRNSGVITEHTPCTPMSSSPTVQQLSRRTR